MVVVKAPAAEMYGCHGRRSWGDEGMHPPTTEAGGWPVQSPPPPTKEMSK